MQTAKPIIRVQGHGRIESPPDVVVLTFTLSTEDVQYARAIDALNEKTVALRNAVVTAGWEAKMLKTASYAVSINTDYDREEGKHVFRGYGGTHRMALRFPLDLTRLGKVLSAVSASSARAEIEMVFTCSDPEAIRQRVLEDAVRNARKRAEVIASAAGQKLGAILAMEYGYVDVRVSSEPMALQEASMECAPELSLEPADVESQDNVSVTWELLA
jgi:uncharacterized protein YggE